MWLLQIIFWDFSFQVAINLLYMLNLHIIIRLICFLEIWENWIFNEIWLIIHISVASFFIIHESKHESFLALFHNGDTAIHLAAKCQHEMVIALLIALSAELDEEKKVFTRLWFVLVAKQAWSLHQHITCCVKFLVVSLWIYCMLFFILVRFFFLKSNLLRCNLSCECNKQLIIKLTFYFAHCHIFYYSLPNNYELLLISI